MAPSARQPREEEVTLMATHQGRDLAWLQPHPEIQGLSLPSSRSGQLTELNLMIQGPGEQSDLVTNPPPKAKALSPQRRIWEIDEFWKKKLIWKKNKESASKILIQELGCQKNRESFIKRLLELKPDTSLSLLS